MSHIGAAMVGNEFAMPKPRLRASAPAAKLESIRGESLPVIPVEAVTQLEVVPVTINRAVALSPALSPFKQFLELIHRHSAIVFACLLLLVGVSGIELGGRYWQARLSLPATNTSLPSKNEIAGLNLTVPAAGLSAKLTAIDNQPATLKVGDQTVAISPDIIKSWLKITPSSDKRQDTIHISSQTMAKSLTGLADKYAVAPVNQVTVTHDGLTQVIIAGRNGSMLTDPGTLSTQAASSAKSVMNSNGLNFNTPLVSQPFQAVTPANFDKLVEVNLATKQLYVYQNGQLINTFLVSAGKPSTPTPTGEFHIWTKLTSQTMVGPGYVQPNVPWVNYFDHSGDAIHGVYWRPASVFGKVNTSHGCVGLELNDAKWFYNWAPIGTTVITHY